MNDFTPTYEAESCQAILDGRPAGLAGEARLVPVAGVDLAFDRVDGHLVRAVVDADDAPAPTLLTRLFGPQVADVLRAAAQAGRAEPESSSSEAGAGPRPLSPEPGLGTALSCLALLDAGRATSPVPPSSPWWAAEAAVLAEQAGLPARALAEARRAVRALERRQVVVPRQAAQAAVTAANIAATEEPEAARRLRENVVIDDLPRRPGLPGLDAAAEVGGLEKDCAHLPGLHWVLDPALVPAGLFRPGLSPYSDLLVRYNSGTGRLVVQATLAPGADGAAVGRCQARLVDPDVWRVLARAHLEQTGSQVQAELQLSSPLDALGETWLEVCEGPPRPVSSSKARLIRRALRWADAALRAERAPAGLAPLSTSEDWAALATLAWERCRRDWAAADDPGRAAAVLEPRVPLPRPAYLAEILGE
jgi:hypothetical protein